MSARPLPSGKCELWLSHQPATLDANKQRVWESWLSSDEHLRYRSFRFEKHRAQYLLTRALVRTTLSAYTRVSPAAWRFSAGPHGKPSIVEPAPSIPLAFNLSNTDGLIACAVTPGIDVGVDVEAIDRAGETIGVADHFFSPREAAELRALPPARQHERFFEYWTLKEAYIKARGLGLAIPLDQFSFVLGAAPDGPIDIVFEPELGDTSSGWQFSRFKPTARHAAAIALRRTDGADVAIEVHEVEPPA